jgi:uncharacterized membrane protein YcjF (UPF0283 family)
MLALLSHHIQATATRTAHTAVLGLGAAISLFVGLGFLTAAAWLLLTTLTTSLIATVILGAAYSGIGFLLLAVMSMRSREKRRARAAALAATASSTTAGNMTAVIAAFMTGLSAGKKARF